jgi:hypothetical protein
MFQYIHIMVTKMKSKSKNRDKDDREDYSLNIFILEKIEYT